MIITKCDRCGAIIEDPKKNKNIFNALIEAIQNEVYQQITYGVSKYVDGGFSRRLDLCKDCQKSLNEWLSVPTDKPAADPDNKGGNV